MRDYSFSETPPSAEDYLRLRELTGMSKRSQKGATIALRNSLFATFIYQHEALIGMGRVIGDGGCFCQVVDIAVHPDHQGQGLGKKIMHKIMSFIDETLPENTLTSLLADVPADKLYKQFGFKPTAPQSVGMGYYATKS